MNGSAVAPQRATAGPSLRRTRRGTLKGLSIDRPFCCPGHAERVVRRASDKQRGQQKSQPKLASSKQRKTAAGRGPLRQAIYFWALAAEAGADAAAADAAGAAFDAAEAAGAAAEAGAEAGAAAEAGADAGAASSFLPQAASASAAIIEANSTDFFICILKRQIRNRQ